MSVDPESKNEDGPILEMDSEAAADTAPPGDAPAQPRRRIALDEMWAWLYDETVDRRSTQIALQKLGGRTEKIDAAIEMLTAIGNSIAFLVDHESAIREYMRSRRDGAGNVVPMKRSGGRR